jgi:GT2 family glycosyltransferase
MARKDIRTKYLEQYASVMDLPESARSLTAVIPAYGEDILLPKLLESLSACALAEKLRVVVVVNHGERATIEDVSSNDRSWDFLQSHNDSYPFELQSLDCRNKGAFFNNKKAGVGLARKIGLDSALASHSEADSVLICLDADCQVSTNYVSQLLRWQEECPDQGTVTIPFEHILPTDHAHRQAIMTYELFLRYYVGGLRSIANPYAHHSMGSAFATRSHTYLAVRGMVRRQAAEDFYFLDKVRKIAPIGTLVEARVYPSSRISERVIFGTGKTMLKARDGDPLSDFYDLRSFPLMKSLRELLRLGGNEAALTALEARSGLKIGQYLGSRNWKKAKAQLFHEKDGQIVSKGRFDDWFDGLETLKLIHFIRDTLYPAQGALEVLPSFARLLGDEEMEENVNLDLEQWLNWGREHIP